MPLWLYKPKYVLPFGDNENPAPDVLVPYATPKYLSENWNVKGLQSIAELAGLNADVATELTMRLKKYQLPVGIPETVTAGIATLLPYGVPLDCTAVVPKKINWLADGLEKAEYQTSAYCVIPALDVVTLT